MMIQIQRRKTKRKRSLNYSRHWQNLWLKVSATSNNITSINKEITCAEELQRFLETPISEYDADVFEYWYGTKDVFKSQLCGIDVFNNTRYQRTFRTNFFFVWFNRFFTANKINRGACESAVFLNVNSKEREVFESEQRKSF